MEEMNLAVVGCQTRRPRSASASGVLCLALLIFAAGGCAHVTNENQALCASAACLFDPSSGYRFDPEKHAGRDTLVILTLSGGGVRASALAYGTLIALRELPGVEPNHSLLDDVDIISSVSGGSVTAAWYALHGEDGLAAPNDRTNTNELLQFLEKGANGAIAWRALNPATLGRYVLTDYQRSDALSDSFADLLYQGATFSDVEAKYKSSGKQPFVMLNATDFGHETAFPFTQNRFDLICSNLSKYKVADAVSASADFPVVFSAVGMKDYAPSCQGVTGWPPSWIARYEGTPNSTTQPSEFASNQLFHIRAARDAIEYADPDPQDLDLHLLDGGVVDNLGIQSTIALEDNYCTNRGAGPCQPDSPGLYQRLWYRGMNNQGQYPHSPRYLKIRHILYIVVNARSRKPSDLDGTVYPPGFIPTIWGLINTPIDNTILYTQNYLTAALEATARKDPNDQEQYKSGVIYPLSQRIVTIDFEMIPDPVCRKNYWQLDTSWSLAAPVIDNLIALPKVMLANSPDLRIFYDRDLSRPTALGPALRQHQFSKDFGPVCPRSKNQYQARIISRDQRS